MAIDCKQFVSSISGVDSSSFANETERAEAKAAAEKLLAKLETPWETTMKTVWLQPALAACLKVGVDLELFKKWSEAGGGSKTDVELAKMTGSDAKLLERLLKHMGSTHVLEELDGGTYKMTPFTESLAVPGHPNAISYHTAVNSPGFCTLPSFLADAKYQNPHDPSHLNWHKTTRSDQNFFQWLAANPQAEKDFGYTMMAYASSKPPMSEVFPTQRLLNGWDERTALLVDVGGGTGHDIEKFRESHPGLPKGSLILQDLDGPIKESFTKDPVEAQAHDFFQPQKVKGARAYYLHIVLHDWPDEKAVEILKNLTAVMTRGYSKVLLHEMVINAKDPHPQTTSSDLTMMMTFSAVERTEADWDALLDQAGLKTVHVWKTPASMESVIEAELA